MASTNIPVGPASQPPAVKPSASTGHLVDKRIDSLDPQTPPEPAAGPTEMSSIPPPLTPADSRIRPILKSEYKAAAATLAGAFAQDAVARYFLDTPDRAKWSEERKWALHVAILEYVTLAHCLKGVALTVGEGFGCVALWMPPGKNMDDLPTVLRSGLWRLKYQLSPEGRKRFFGEFLPLMHDTKASVLGSRDPESWYLVYIGTKEEARGKGYARRLIEHVTTMADREGRPCYLESSNDVNPIIYGKLGFEVKRKLFLKRAEEDVEMDIMVREPKGAVGKEVGEGGNM